MERVIGGAIPMDVFPLATEDRQYLGYVYLTASDANQRTRCHIVLY
ncbi:MAG: hypothetical protein ABFD64_06475 [Armatimonadota bacterium]